ncbi:hypothetical protein Q7F05_11275 [Pseudomonas sp. Lb2C1-1]|uniref:hypothetical protein n=1 Tax=Pseudomonas TaxID=286 RepID=UPI000B2C2F4E|nr:hypothetical protein [Pseudomonas ogarae]
MSETVSTLETDQDQTTEVTPSAPATLEENKAVQDSAAPAAAPVIVWRTLMLEQ